VYVVVTGTVFDTNKKTKAKQQVKNEQKRGGRNNKEAIMQEKEYHLHTIFFVHSHTHAVRSHALFHSHHARTHAHMPVTKWENGQKHSTKSPIRHCQN